MLAKTAYVTGFVLVSQGLCLETGLGVYAGGSEVTHSILDMSGTLPLYEAGIYGLVSNPFLKARGNVGFGTHQSELAYTADLSVGPVVRLWERRLELGVAAGVGYLAYRQKKEFIDGPERFVDMSDVPRSLNFVVGVFERVDLSFEKKWDSRQLWRITLGARVF